MPSRDHRWVGRVNREVPARILTHDGWIDVVVRDLSRNGIGIAFSPERVGADQDSSLGEVARHLASALPEKVSIEFRPDVLGQLLARTLRIVRVRAWDPLAMDMLLGCVLDRPFTDDEVVALGILLPDHGETAAEARRRLAAPPAPSPDRPHSA